MFLGDSNAAGISLITFYHRQLALVAKKRYLTPERSVAVHTRLADHFQRLPPRSPTPATAPNIRRAYELAYQLRHLEPAAGSPRLRAELAAPEPVSAKIDAGLGRDLLRDYALAAHFDAQLIPILAAFFVAEYSREDTSLARAFKPDDLHSYFAYEKSRTFYQDVLQRLSTAEAITGRERRIRDRAKVDWAGMLRRNRNFDRARDLLGVVEQSDSALTDADRAAGFYEIGYIHYLHDQHMDASRAMRESARLAVSDRDAVGAAISRSVAAWSDYFCQPDSAGLSTLMKEEQEVLEVFLTEQHSEPRAVRWVMNALAHLVNAAYLAGDADMLIGHLRNLRANPWVREFGTQGFLLRYEARYAMTRGDFASACRTWEELFTSSQVKLDDEGAAWPILDYGIALQRLGHRTLAAVAYTLAFETLTPGANNDFWRARAASALRALPWWARLRAHKWRVRSLAELVARRPRRGNRP